MQRSERIKEEAKAIMQRFFTSISVAHLQLKRIGVTRHTQTREASPVSADASFRESFLAQAPSDGTYILAEKKKW